MDFMAFVGDIFSVAIQNGFRLDMCDNLEIAFTAGIVLENLFDLA